jgi:hypothetical protein
MPMFFRQSGAAPFGSFVFLQPSLNRAGETPALPGEEPIDTAKKMHQFE